MIRITVLILAAWLAGCAAMGDRPAHRYYVLEPRSTTTTTRGIAVAAAPTTAASFYDTQDIAYSRSPGTRGYYQFNHWTERPQRVIHAELLARFGRAADGYILATHLVELYHDAADVPGTVRITIAAELIDRAHRATVSRRTFSRTAPAASHDASGAVAGFDDASGRILDDIVEWVDGEVVSRSGR